jgi:parvulin-like peptidyl-prolyl isomerase
VNRKLFLAGCFGAACVAGILTGHALKGSGLCRSALGLLFGRGELLAVVKGEGIYQEDVSRVVYENDYRSGDDGAVKSSEAQRSALLRLMANAALGYQSRQESIPQSAIDREYEVLEAQLRDKSTWSAGLIAQSSSADSFRAEIAKNLRAEQWIEQQLVPQVKVTTEQCREYYDAHKMDYILPVRFRARHLFAAAPPETPPEVVDAKNRAIEMLSTRLAHGEDFGELAGLCSEDEATKTRGGDLGFFSEYRMPLDFITALKDMRAGEVSSIVRTGLGFHLVQLLEMRGPRQVTFDEAEPGIRLKLENGKRLQACKTIATELSDQAEFVRLAGDIE